MEIAGAALGTTIAEYVGALYLVYVTIAKKNKFFTRPDLKRIISSKVAPYLKSIKLGLSSACEDLLWNIGNLCIIRILNTINVIAAGIYSMVFTLEIIFVVVIGSLGSGIRGYGDTKWMFFNQALGTVGVVALACICVFVFKLGMLGVFIAVLCDEAIRAVINFIRFLRIKFCKQCRALRRRSCNL